MKHLISITLDEATTITHDVSVLSITDAFRMRNIVAIHKLISQFSIFTLRRRIHNLFSLRKECVSCFFDDEMLFAIDHNIVVYMS
jgi:rRNA maturation endonuclease Nob1